MSTISVAFDLDGTLVDTAPDLIATLNKILGDIGLGPVASDIVRPKIAFGARRMIEVALAELGSPRPEDEIDRHFAAFITHYRRNMAVESRPFPAARETLQALKTEGARLGVCTNKREDLTIELLDQLDLARYFDAVLGRDTLDVCKPHPRHLTETISRAGGDTARAVMIGDAETDVKTARAAGIPVIGATFGYTDTPMADLAPDALFDHYDALPGLIATVTASRS